MKRICPHEFDDAAAMHELVNSSDAYLAYFIRHGGQPILALYGQYEEFVLNPIPVESAVRPLALFSHLMINAYLSPPKPFQSLKNAVQKKLSPNVCPMCGSLKTGTGDHYFPKDDFPEFAIYSKNLIPACDCNSQRGSALKGRLPGQWIIHPFYEDALMERIVSINFDFTPNGLVLSIRRLFSATIPQARIDFHIEKIHSKTTMLDWALAEWAAHLANPIAALIWDPSGAVSIEDVSNRVDQVMKGSEKKLGTPNNWVSAFYHGINSSRRALELLTDAINTVLA
jgi:hypothetical protein